MPSQCPDCISWRAGICGRLDARTYAALTAGGRTKNLPVNTELWSDTASRRFLGVLISGVLRLVRFSPDGRRRVLDLTLPGELLIERGLGQRGLSLETATAVRLCQFDQHLYDRMLVQRADFRREVHWQTEAMLERLRQLTWSLGTTSPEERLAAFLVKATRMLPWQPLPTGGGRLTIEISRADIADLLGTTVESISRITQKFHREGIIRIRDPWHFEIPDLNRLAQRGGLTGRRTSAAGTSRQNVAALSRSLQNLSLIPVKARDTCPE